MRTSRRFLVATLAALALLQFPALAALDKKPKSAAFVVYRVDVRPGGEIEVTLATGEVWRQIRPDVKLELQRGDSVVIRRRGGAFVLESSKGLSTRVKRVQ
jgi:hypothetical protein